MSKLRNLQRLIRKYFQEHLRYNWMQSLANLSKNSLVLFMFLYSANFRQPWEISWSLKCKQAKKIYLDVIKFKTLIVVDEFSLRWKVKVNRESGVGNWLRLCLKNKTLEVTFTSQSILKCISYLVLVFSSKFFISSGKFSLLILSESSIRIFRNWDG